LIVTLPVAMTVAPSSKASEISLFVAVPLASAAMAEKTAPSHGRTTMPPPYADIGARARAMGKLGEAFMNWLRTSPANSPLNPS